jgi:glutamine synthetase
MAMDAKAVLQLIKDKNIQIVDTRFTDLFGGWQHYSLPASRLSEEMISEGLGFDGSSIKGFQAIHESDMLMMPDVMMKLTIQLLFPNPFQLNLAYKWKILPQD